MEKEGEWKQTDKKGKLTAIYHYVKNLRDGAFIEYDSLGAISNEGIYRADTIFSETRQTKEAIAKEVMPMMASCMQEDLEERKNVQIKLCSNISIKV
ncbi:MAG: hypothetical protein IPN86_13915 [Saprospiraceae bacterium]|nr:hypothetical protein [Saprospiraceae bacterium]